MRQFLVDEIPRRQMETIKSYLKNNTSTSGLDSVYWLEVPPDLLAAVQLDHHSCGPHYLAIEVGKDFIKFEFLVRSRHRLRCDCVRYADAAQESFLLDFAHSLIETLHLSC